MVSKWILLPICFIISDSSASSEVDLPDPVGPEKNIDPGGPLCHPANQWYLPVVVITQLQKRFFSCRRYRAAAVPQDLSNLLDESQFGRYTAPSISKKLTLDAPVLRSALLVLRVRNVGHRAIHCRAQRLTVFAIV
ncbi:hypothetical protein ACFS07_35710 [Undibacterium arcticum]